MHTSADRLLWLFGLGGDCVIGGLTGDTDTITGAATGAATGARGGDGGVGGCGADTTTGLGGAGAGSGIGAGAGSGAGFGSEAPSLLVISRSRVSKVSLEVARRSHSSVLRSAMRRVRKCGSPAVSLARIIATCVYRSELTFYSPCLFSMTFYSNLERVEYRAVRGFEPGARGERLREPAIGSTQAPSWQYSMAS